MVDESIGDPRDRRLSEALASLPTERASPGFTARVLARLDREPEPARPSRWLFATLAAAALAAATVGLETWRKHSDLADARKALAEIRAEHRDIVRELNWYDGDGTPSLVYLGGDERIDLVVDLARVKERPAEPSPHFARN